jgi:hypothetical protein
MAKSNAERQKQYRKQHKATKTASVNAPQSMASVTGVQLHHESVTNSNEIVTKTDSNVVPVTIANKFSGSPVHSLPDDYEREKYIGLLPDVIYSDVLRQHNGIRQMGVEDDLDLRIVRALHYQRVMV